MQASDYVVSLDMAQRPELHEAMTAAGCGEPGIVDNPQEGYSDYVWRVYNPCKHQRGEPFCGTRDYFCGFGYPVSSTFWPAYSIGELWCAAERLKAALPKNNRIELCIQPDYWIIQWVIEDACGLDTVHSPDFAHAPDALAALVIELHAAGGSDD